VSSTELNQRYQDTYKALVSICEGEIDEIALMSTIVCELHNSIPGFDWTGFYRVTSFEQLKVGPYQGGHGCLSIPFSRGVCGRAASTKKTQLVRDVNTLPYHIACSSSTQSEIVVPVFDKQGEVRAVLDVDSNQLANFSSTDQKWLEKIVMLLTPCYDRVFQP